MIRLADHAIHIWRVDGAASGGVRAVCARYLDAPFEIRRAPLGKPFIAGADLEIGISNTEGATVVGVSRRPLGIDVERIGPLAHLSALARASLTWREALELECLPVERRVARFHRFWVRKEALLKARGCGFAVDPRCVDTTRPASGWHWIDATLDEGIALAVATPDSQARLEWMAAA
jgi:phosphopantetheinyl transferase